MTFHGFTTPNLSHPSQQQTTSPILEEESESPPAYSTELSPKGNTDDQSVNTMKNIDDTRANVVEAGKLHDESKVTAQRDMETSEAVVADTSSSPVSMRATIAPFVPTSTTLEEATPRATSALHAKTKFTPSDKVTTTPLSASTKSAENPKTTPLLATNKPTSEATTKTSSKSASNQEAPIPLHAEYEVI